MKYNLMRDGMCLLLFCVFGSLFITSNAETKPETKPDVEDCRIGHMVCRTTKKCVPLSWKCDGDNDCGQNDTTDEEHCPPKTCADQEFKCGDGSCVPGRWQCDGENDCDDHLDEDSAKCLTVEPSCGLNEFSCGDGQCIQDSWKCDGAVDCDTGADEKNCSVACGEDFFTCKHQTQCISKSWQCDGDADCIDESDEKDCESKECKEGEFRCQDSTRCIDVKWKCDGEFDCSDHSDEIDCSHNPTDIDLCSATDFKCVDSGDCIHLSWKCDGDPDCTDGSDEGDNCTYTCREDQFKCNNNYCISKALQCDHSPDCLDGSDELNCNITKSCADRGEFDCYNDGTYCIANDKVCDGVNDCQHREDEEAFICKHKNPCAQKKCGEHSHCVNQVMTHNKMEAVCTCDSGFEFHEVEQVCKDVNECEEFGRCSQICNNTKGGYKCLCQPGYTLEKHYFCRANGDHSWLYYANRRDIRRLRTDSRYMEIIVQDTTNSVALDIDYEQGLMFWTDGAEEIIQSAKINGQAVLATDIKTVVQSDGIQAFAADGIAVDWLYKNIYWTDTGSDKIKVSDYEGKNVKTLIDTQMDDPRAICLDPESGYMYWSDWGKVPKIERSSMDGTKRETIVRQSDGLEWPNGLTIDYVGKRIYWIDSKLHNIGSASLDGSDFKHILVDPREIRRPFSISVFEDSLYWTDWHTNSIRSVNKFTGHNPQTLSLGSYSVMDIAVYHEKKQVTDFAATATTLCSQKKCEHLCLPVAHKNTTAAHEVVCACRDGSELKSDQKTCTISATTPAAPTTPVKNTTAQTPKSTEKPTTVAPEETTQKGGYTVVPENRTESNVPGNQDKHNNVGVIAITAAAVVLFILIAVFVVSFLVYRRYSSRNKKSMNFDNPVYRKTTTTEEQCMISQDDALSPQTQPLTLHHENV